MGPRRRPGYAPRAAAMFGIVCWLALALDAGASNDTSRFERKDALAISQAAHGRTIADVTLTRVDGSRFDLAELRGRPLVVSLIFTSCHHVCPTTTQYLKQAVLKARDALGENSFRVITVGFDWRRDTPSMMRRFASEQGVDIEGWEFVAADEQTVELLTEQLGFAYYPSGGGFDHLIQTSILDEHGTLYRQVYGMRFPVPHLVEPLKELVFETGAHQSLLSELTNRVLLFCTVYDPASDTYRFRYDIFVGLAIGLTLGMLAIALLIREWRHTSAWGSRL